MNESKLNEIKLRYYKELEKELVGSLNRFYTGITFAEDEVCRGGKYWKASDTLNRLLIILRREYAGIKATRDDLYKKMAAEIKDASREPERSMSDSKSTDKMEERFDKLEERGHNDVNTGWCIND